MAPSADDRVSCLGWRGGEDGGERRPSKGEEGCRGPGLTYDALVDDPEIGNGNLDLYRDARHGIYGVRLCSMIQVRPRPPSPSDGPGSCCGGRACRCRDGRRATRPAWL